MDKLGTSESQKVHLNQLSTTIENLLKIATALAVFSYVFGVIVSTIHLGRFGYSSLGLLQISYVVTGIWLFIPTVLLLVAIAPFPLLSIDSLNQSSRNKILYIFLSAIGFLATYAVVIFLLLIMLNSKLETYSFFGWLLVGFIGSFIFVTTCGVFLSISKTKSNKVLLPSRIEKIVNLKNDISPSLIFMVYILAFPLYLALFTSIIYPAIPAVIGGGGEIKAVLIAKDDESKSLIESAGIEFNSLESSDSKKGDSQKDDSKKNNLRKIDTLESDDLEKDDSQKNDLRKTVPLKIILSTEKEILVASDNQEVKGIKLDASLVAGIIYKK
jgi:hypothetical protein